MIKEFSGRDFDTFFGDFLVNVDEASITLEGGKVHTKKKGRPNGYTEGPVSASGSIQVNTTNFLIIHKAAEKAGSFMDIEPIDIVMNSEIGNKAFKVEAFGCVLNITDLLSIDPNASDEINHTIEFEVAGPEFIRINGTPYLRDSEIENLT